MFTPPRLVLLRLFVLLLIFATPGAAFAAGPPEPPSGATPANDVLSDPAPQACWIAPDAAAPQGSLPSCIPATIAGSLGSGSSDYRGTSGAMPKRLFRDGVPSTCAAPKSTQNIYGEGVFRYDAYTFMNYGAQACVTVEFAAPACPVQVWPVTYRGSFNPADVQANYLADSGSSTAQGSPARTYSFTIPTNVRFVVVVSEVTASSATCPYTLKVTGITGCPQVWGYVFLDANGNGIRDAAEQDGLPNVYVTLTPGVSGAATTVTKGYYLFTSVPPDDYCAVAAIPAGYRSTSPAQVCFNVKNNTVVNFGVQANSLKRVFVPMVMKR